MNPSETAGTSERHSPIARKQPVGCVKRTEAGPNMGRGAFHAPYVAAGTLEERRPSRELQEWESKLDLPDPEEGTTPAKLGLPRNHTPEEYFAKVIEQHQQQHGCGSVPGGLARAAGELLHPEVDPARELLAKVSYAVGCFGFGCGRLRCPSPSPSESEHADGTDAEEGQGRGFRNGLNVDVNGVAGDVGVTSQLQDAWARRRARQGTGGVYDVAPGGGHRLLYPGVIDRAQSGPSHHCFASIGRPSARLLRRRWVAGSMEKLMTWTEPSQKAI